MMRHPGIQDISILRHRDPVVAMAIVALQRVAYRAEAERVGYPDLPPLKESPADIMACGETFFGITRRGPLAAIAAVEESEAGTSITRLCVRPDCTRRGLASRLVRHALAVSRDPVTVSTAAANDPAIALYRGLGFEIVREWTTPDGLPLVTLEHPGPESPSR